MPMHTNSQLNPAFILASISFDGVGQLLTDPICYARRKMQATDLSVPWGINEQSFAPDSVACCKVARAIRLPRSATRRTDYPLRLDRGLEPLGKRRKEF